MVQTVIMPKLGQTVEESTILKWHKHAGDRVKNGDILFEIETDKAVLEVESFFDGTLLKIVVQEGETVPVTTPVAFIGQPGDPIPAVAPIPKPAPQKPEPAVSSSQALQPRARGTKDSDPALPAAPSTLEPVPLSQMPTTPARLPEPTARVGQGKAISPRARRLIKECAVSADPIAGTGTRGRIVEKDVREYLDSQQYHSIRITPTAKALAIKENIDILSIDCPDDRITVKAVRQAIAEKPKPMSKIRRLIAERMTQSFTTTPHFFVTVSVDMTDLLALRKAFKEKGRSYSVTDFILKSVALALAEFPAVNSTTDGRTVQWHSRIHLGLAVAIKDGIVVPVIRDANEISLSELHERVTNLAARARDGKLTLDEITGSTFTVSNMGMLDVENFTAIINPGESAILAVSSVQNKPVVVSDAIVIRAMMKITLSSDHRIVDGVTAAKFTNRVKSILEDMKSWNNLI